MKENFREKAQRMRNALKERGDALSPYYGSSDSDLYVNEKHGIAVVGIQTPRHIGLNKWGKIAISEYPMNFDESYNGSQDTIYSLRKLDNAFEKNSVFSRAF